MPKRKTNYIPWIILGVVLILFILYIANNSFKNKVDTSLSDTPSPDTSSNTAQPTTTCAKAFNNCMEIGRARGYTITLVNKDSIDNPNEASTFYRLWRGVQQSDYLRTEINKTRETLSYPITMFVVEFKHEASVPQSTTIVICNSDGALLKVTSSWACGK
ncbi:MAG: hypothetical protein Q8N63_07525 [Nanoarchaeota archaeon]|nr:hypothetical protein [Nanoarchaeota archaeon]